MPEVRQYKVYRFDELPEESKAKARENYRNFRTEDIYADHILSWCTPVCPEESQAKALEPYRNFGTEDIYADHILSWYASVGETWIAEQKEKGLEYRLRDIRFNLSYCPGDGASADVDCFDPELFFPGKEGRILKWLEEKGHIEFNFYRINHNYVHYNTVKAEIVYRFDRQRYTKLYDLIDDAAYNLNDYLKSSFKDLEKRLYKELEDLESDETLADYFVFADCMFTLDGLID